MDGDQRKGASSSQIASAIASGISPMDELSSCLIIDILSRLPIKTILNCRCVCKTWLHFISDSYFAQVHLERSPTCLLIETPPNYPESRNVQLAQITGKPKGSRFHVVDRMKFVPEINLPYDDFFIFHSFNGLLCFARTFRDTFHDDIYLCNPILGEYISVPLAGSQETRQKSYFALGLSAIAKEYKVLRTFYLKTGDNVQPEAEIYTLGTGQWRSIQNALRGPHECMFDSFVCGSFHWVLSNQQNRVNGIGSFSFESEQFSQLSLPTQYHHGHVGVTVFEGCLGVSFYETCEQFEIWVMKKYAIKESWTKKFTITNQAFSCRNLYDPLIFLNNGLILMLGDNKRFVFYDTRRKFMNVIRISQTRGDIYVTAYKPSFVSLKEVAKGEQVKMSRKQASGKDDKSSAEGTSNCTSHDQLSKSVSPEYRTN